MKLLIIQRNTIEYEFRYLGNSKVVEVSKDGVFSYSITLRNSYLQCSCPGAKYHKKCWHVSIVSQLLKLPDVTEPWVEWAEEAGEMMYS